MASDLSMETVTEEEAEGLYMASFIKSRQEAGPDHAPVLEIPPTRILLLPDIFEEAWGWDRLLPQDFCTMPFYLDYLKEYHRRNGVGYIAAAAADGESKPRPEEWPLKAWPVVDGVSKCSQKYGMGALTAAARFCLDMELQFMSEWKDRPVRNVKRLSEKIQERACYLIFMGRDFSEPAAASLVCIANEAALACELLRQGAEATAKELKLCNYLRQCALSLMYVTGPHSDASAAAMVAVAKEAKRMREWMRKANKCFYFSSYTLYHKMGLCDTNRTSTFGVMKHILSSSTGRDKPYVVMDFGEIKNGE